MPAEIIGVFIAFCALLLTTLGMMVKVGRLIGVITSNMERMTKDISVLWEHQRTQDARCEARSQIFIEGITIGRETKEKVDLLYQQIVGRGIGIREEL